jgi:hypothetical protein
MIAALIHASFVKHEERYHHFVWDEVTTQQPDVQVEVSEATPLLGNRPSV